MTRHIHEVPQDAPEWVHSAHHTIGKMHEHKIPAVICAWPNQNLVDEKSHMTVCAVSLNPTMLAKATLMSLMTFPMFSAALTKPTVINIHKYMTHLLFLQSAYNEYGRCEDADFNVEDEYEILFKDNLHSILDQSVKSNYSLFSCVFLQSTSDGDSYSIKCEKKIIVQETEEWMLRPNDKLIQSSITYDLIATMAERVNRKDLDDEEMSGLINAITQQSMKAIGQRLMMSTVE